MFDPSHVGDEENHAKASQSDQPAGNENMQRLARQGLVSIVFNDFLRFSADLPGAIL
jgi:hypothetical protein